MCGNVDPPPRFHGNMEWPHFNTNFNYFNSVKVIHKVLISCHLSGSFIHFKTGALSSSAITTNSSLAPDEGLHAQTTATAAAAVSAADVLTHRFQIQIRLLNSSWERCSKDRDPGGSRRPHPRGCQCSNVLLCVFCSGC